MFRFLRVQVKRMYINNPSQTDHAGISHGNALLPDIFTHPFSGTLKRIHQEAAAT